ncbi:hypothetical protein CNO14_05660 (plasmid) [Borrelia miyamotoi]|uniref:Uncharacterized protein n=4 Tax=Borrelia miyamotoi TaxID=47466 RepID=A0AAQ3CN26_9SPIR|nr:hypothetical protein [Borrelia miyamotoi]MBW6184811.1 hypothetical protein [Pseudomonas aeruginosa]AHH05808.1 Hypothetical protein BOM_1265 [Borrelia miyamotoi FR64b]ATQ15459.1 hypothetical protein CNO14_05660 [Borrelia miyamotoi]ATQ16658.1 hypothetical protein CNO13_05765 [Borrelia miyamotoi]ATQ17892.1 hypothetical protein CNO12_06275 [Borrelia miyamotoi]
MPDFDFTKAEKSFTPGLEHKSGLHQTETAIVDVGSEAISPGDLVIASQSSSMGDILVKKATSSTVTSSNNIHTVRGFAMKKTNIASHERENYLPGDLVPIRRSGEVVVTLDTSFSDPKIGQYVFFKDGKLVKGKEGIQVGRIKDVSISSESKVVLLDIQIGPAYDSSGNRKFA